MDTSATEASRGSYGTMALVRGAHSISHFFQLAVPVLFPLIKDELDVGYAELGLLATLFYVASGFCQSGSGILSSTTSAHGGCSLPALASFAARY